MKKIIFTICFMAAGAVPALAQAELSFKKWRIIKDVSTPDIKLDTVIRGNTYLLACTVENNTNEEFSGSIDFNIHADPNADFSTKVSEGTFTVDNIVVPAFGSYLIIKNLLIDNVFEDSTNVVIVWPTVSYSDNDGSNDHGTFNIWVESSLKTGFANSEDINFSLFPNPANGIITIQSQEFFNGTISILDFQGRQLNYIRLNNRKNIVLTLEDFAGNKLSKGVYSIVLQSSQSVSVQKLIVE